MGIFRILESTDARKKGTIFNKKFVIFSFPRFFQRPDPPEKSCPGQKNYYRNILTASTRPRIGENGRGNVFIFPDRKTALWGAYDVIA